MMKKVKMWRRKLWKNQKGFTLIEMMIVVGIIAILTAVAIPKFNESLAMANTARVQADLQSLDTAIAMYRVQNGRLPQSLESLKDYIDVDDIKAPTGEVYINGKLEDNSSGENYKFTTGEQNATFMGHKRNEFGKSASSGQD